MSKEDIIHFEILKKEVVKKLQKTHSVNSDIKNWKGQDIIYLQDDLSDKVNGRISEKWFYTHLKSDSEKLPRIDMLNILSEYAGYQNWNDLKNQFPKTKNPNKKSKPYLIISLLILVILAITIISFKFLHKKNVYEFCFVDADLKSAITAYPIWVIWINEHESPMITKCDSTGCFKFVTASDKIQFVVRSPYYKTDTITRIVYNKKNREEQIQLKSNDYALMIHLFSKSKVKNWKKRRRQLNQMLADNARIYQVYEDGKATMEILNKKEFINKLTVPLKSLKDIEVIETIYTGDKISILRFKQNTTVK